MTEKNCRLRRARLWLQEHLSWLGGSEAALKLGCHEGEPGRGLLLQVLAKALDLIQLEGVKEKGFGVRRRKSSPMVMVRYEF